jgi:hypothetical protein
MPEVVEVVKLLAEVDETPGRLLETSADAH